MPIEIPLADLLRSPDLDLKMVKKYCYKSLFLFVLLLVGACGDPNTEVQSSKIPLRLEDFLGVWEDKLDAKTSVYWVIGDGMLVYDLKVAPEDKDRNGRFGYGKYYGVKCAYGFSNRNTVVINRPPPDDKNKIFQAVETGSGRIVLDNTKPDKDNLRINLLKISPERVKQLFPGLETDAKKAVDQFIRHGFRPNK